MKNVKTYSEFVVENIDMSIPSGKLNESIFDSLKNFYTKISDMFNNPDVLKKQVDQAEVKAGPKDDRVLPKGVKNGTTLIIKLVDPTNSDKKSILSLTKLGDLPDSSGFFQITGSDNDDFLKSLGVNNVTDLNNLGVMAIIDSTGFLKDKSLSMRIYKNISRVGKPTVTQAVIKSSLMADAVAKEKVEE